MRKTIFVSLILLLVAGCEERKRGFYYKEVLLDVNCGDKFKGQVYELGHTTASIYSILYEDMEGRRIELPQDECVKILIKKLPKPTMLRK